MPLLSQELSRKEFIKAVQDADFFFYYKEDYETAARNPKNISHIFAELEGVKEVKVEGLYKYYYGEYKTLSKAKEALIFVNSRI